MNEAKTRYVIFKDARNDQDGFTINSLMDGRRYRFKKVILFAYLGMTLRRLLKKTRSAGILNLIEPTNVSIK